MTSCATRPAGRRGPAGVAGYVVRRAAAYAAMVVVATTIAYFAAVSTLDPRAHLSEQTPRPSPHDVQSRLAALGLDPEASPFARYGHWLGGVLLHFDWGLGPDGSSVGAEFWPRALVSARLVLVATVVSIIVGVVLGVCTAAHRYRPADRLATTLAYLVGTIPAAVLCLAVQLAAVAVDDRTGRPLLPVVGMSSPIPSATWWEGGADAASHLLLPTIALVLLGCPGFHLLQRAVLLEAVEADHVRAARARGLTRGQAIRRHALRTSFVPVAQHIALAVPTLLTGAFVVERVFGWQGLGTYTLDAITRTQDVNAAVAAVAFGAATYALAAVAGDVAVAALDPRIRVG